MFTDRSKKTIGIIAAMTAEIDALKEKMTAPQRVEISGIEFVFGELNGMNAVMAVSGIGKVFAAVCAQTMILKFSPDFVISMGVAGGLAEGLEIGGAVIGTSVVQHDMDTTPLGDPPGLISGINKVYFECAEELVALLEQSAKEEGCRYVKGVIASGDCFVGSREQRERIISSFDAAACEMESASIGQVCYINGVDYAALRTISDNGDENSGNDYSVCMKKAADMGIAVVKRLLDKI